MKAKMKSTRTFGVEIEFTSDSYNREDVASELRHYGIDAESQDYNHNTQRVWKVITDSSCGYEIVSPVLKGNEGLEETRKVLDILNRMDGVKVDSHCGIHVHVHLEGYNPHNMINLVKTYMKYQDEINMVLPRSRRGTNRFCRDLVRAFSYNWGDNGGSYSKLFSKLSSIQTKWKSGNYTDRDAMYQLDRCFGTRYTTLNLECYSRYGTVEFRQHGGSLNSEKVSTWIVFCSNLVDRCAKVKFVQEHKTENVLHNFANIFGEKQSRPVLKYLESRALHFGFNTISGAYAHATEMRRV